jgi:PleD family two-component response regulator
MTSAEFPANLILLRPNTIRRAVTAPRVLLPVMSRAQLLERLDTVGSLAPSAPLSFLVIRVDGIDTSARRRADDVLRSVANRTRELIRSTDYLGRFDDGVFGVVLQGTGATAASAVAARLTHHLEQDVATQLPDASVSVYAATGIGANATVLPWAAMDSLGDCC